MAERLPVEIFNRPALSEAPHRVNQPENQTVLNVYNRVLGRLITRGQDLENRLIRGDFNSLGQIRARQDSGQALTAADQLLVEDFSTLIDSRIAREGRRNLNIAEYIGRVNRMESNGQVLDPQAIEIRQQYQLGEFSAIQGGNYPLETRVSDRFTVPARDEDKDAAIFDGAPVEGIIRFIDRELRENAQNINLSARERNNRANALRRERDILFTSSTSLFVEQDRVSHARNQLESYYIYNNPLLSQYEMPDWLGGENLLEDRRVLDLPARGSRRWPLLLPIPLLLPLLLSVSTNPCYGTGGDLRMEVFSPEAGQTPSLKGAIEREMSYPGMGLAQTEYRSDSDIPLTEERDRIMDSNGEYYRIYMDTAAQDYLQTAQRIRGDHQDSVWIDATDFSPRLVLASCLSPEARDKKTKETINREANPRWYDGITSAWTNLTRFIPRVNIALR